MSNAKMDALFLQHEVEQFYYKEARLLDNRQYQTWFALVHPDIRYTLPARGNPLVDNRESDKEAMIATANELERAEDDAPAASPIRDEGYAHLFLRVDRSFKKNSWAENPPARTRRIVGNVEITADDGEQISVISAFHLFYARPGGRDFMYAGQRNDTLVRNNDNFQILQREIIMDMADIDLPTLGLFF